METQCIRILIVFYMFKANPVNGIGMNYNNKSLANKKQTTKNEPTLIDHIRRHLLNRYSITVNLIVITFLKLSEITFHFITWNQFGVIDSWWLATRIKKIMRRNLSSRILHLWEIYYPYTGAAEILLLRNEKFIIRKLLTSLLSTKMF